MVSKVQIFLYELLLMVINMHKHNYGKRRNQGSAVTQTTLGGLTRLYIPRLQISSTIYVCQKL